MNSKLKSRPVALCVLALLFNACSSPAPGTGGAAPTPATGPGAGSTGAAAAISASDKPLDVITKALRGQLDAKSYRVHVTATAGENTSKMVIEYAAPDRYRMVTEPQSGAGRGAAMEFIIVGGASYIKGPNGQWVRSPVDAGEMIKSFRDPKMLEELAKNSDARLVGPDTLDGAPMLVYQYTVNKVMGMDMKSDTRTWLAVSDGLPRKSESEGVFNGMKTKTLMTITDYNSDIKIEPPAK